MAVLVIRENQAREFLRAIGRVKLAKGGLNRIAMAMNNLKELSVEEGKSLEENLPEGLKKFAMDLAQATVDEKEIQIEELNGEPKTEGNGTPKLKKEKQQSPSGKKDACGCLLDGVPHQINLAVTKEFQSVEVIAKACGQTVGRVKNHLRYWEKRTGYFKQNDKGLWRMSN